MQISSQLVGIAGEAFQAQERTSQVLILKDPTPREPDLDKRFTTTSPPLTVSPAQIAAYNRQRFQLIGQASVHLHSLATALLASVEQQRETASAPQEAQLAGAIETLAENVSTAMATSPSRPSAKKAKAPADTASSSKQSAELTTEVKRLVTLTEALQVEVRRSGVDTLSLGVLIKSAQIKELAHSLKQRFQVG